MRKRNSISIALIFLVMIIFIAACSEKITHNDGRLIETSIKINSSELAEALSAFRLTVTAEDIDDPIIVPLDFDGSVLSGEAIVPIGSARTFTIDALDDLGQIIYSGSTTVDVVRDVTLQLIIDLSPIIPVLKLTPRSSNINMGDSIDIDVSIFNATEISSMEFDIDYTSESGTINSPQVIPSETLDPNIGVSWGAGEVFSTIWVSFIDGSAGLIVDDTGYAHLATLRFFTHSDTDMDLDSAYIQIPRIDALDTARTAVNNIFGDKARIVLTRIQL